jgi:hypothetical protein
MKQVEVVRVEVRERSSTASSCFQELLILDCSSLLEFGSRYSTSVEAGLIFRCR